MKPASTARLAAYGFLGLPLAMAALPIYVHVPKFYADTLGLSLAGVGAMLLAARLLDAVQDPLLGWWSDRRRARTGHRWAFVLAGAPLLALGMVGLFTPPAWEREALGWWLVANLVLVYTAYSLVTVSYQAHGAEISDDRVERTRWPLPSIHGPCADFTPPFPVRGIFGYQGEPLLIPDVDLLAA